MIDIGRGVRIVTRSEWGARPTRSFTPVTPSFGTTVHWEGPHMGWPWAHAACFSLVRGIQNFHMDSRGWVDIAYSYLVCGHGFVFEGRGLRRRTAANGTNDGNNRAYAVCYLGGQGDPFTDQGRNATRAVLDWLDRNGAGPGRNGHRDWKATECPGDSIYGWVHSGQHATSPTEDDMDIADLRTELTTQGTPSRTQIRALAKMGATDAAKAEGGVLDLLGQQRLEMIVGAAVMKSLAPDGVAAEPLKALVREVLAEGDTPGS